MSLNAEFLEKCEEFFDLIANQEKNEELSETIDFLRTALESDVDGWTSLGDFDLAELVQENLERIWELISEEEKSANYLLDDYMADIMDTVERVFRENGDLYSGGDDDDSEEESDFESYEEDGDELEEDEW